MSEKTSTTTSSAQTKPNQEKDTFGGFSPTRHKKYNFIFTILRKAKDDADNPVTFLVNLYSILCSSLFIIITIALSSLLPATMVVIGIIYRNECPINDKIPMWLIIYGSVSIFHIAIRVVSSIHLRNKNRKTKSHSSDSLYITCSTLLIGLFQLVWFLIGNSWVYSINDQVNFSNSDPTKYCNQVCYLFSFWSILFYWIISGLFLLFIIGLILFFVISLIWQKYNKRTIHNVTIRIR